MIHLSKLTGQARAGLLVAAIALTAAGCSGVSTTGDSSIYKIAEAGMLNELTAELNKGRFNINQQDENGMTLLHHAAMGNNFHVIEYLTESRGANAGLRDNQDRTPFDIAVAQENWAAAQVLQGEY